MNELKSYINQISPVEDSVLNELITLFKPTQLQKGEYFVKDGEFAQQVGFLTSGIARAFFLNSEGKEYTK